MSASCRIFWETVISKWKRDELDGPQFTRTEAGELLVLKRFSAWEKYKYLTNELATSAAGKNLTREAILLEATNQLMNLIKTEPTNYYTNAFKGRFNHPIDLSLPMEKRNYCFIPALDTPALGGSLECRRPPNRIGVAEYSGT